MFKLQPILLNQDHRLNVEEKKARRMDMGNSGGMGRPGSGRGGMNSNNMRGGPMGGPQGGRGGPRGGSFNRGSTGGGSRGGYNPRR